MTVKRIVPNFSFADPGQTKAFYQEIFDLTVEMDFGWIVTFGSGEVARAQLSIASEGGSGTDVPDISIEVDNLDGVHDKAINFGADIVYGPVDEPWGVRRFFVKAPCGRILNVMTH